MISAFAVMALTVGVAGQRLAGMFLLRGGVTNPRLARLVGLIPITVISSVVALQTLTTRGDITIDARLAGVGAAALLTWRRAPLALVVVAAAAVTAALRAVGVE